MKKELQYLKLLLKISCTLMVTSTALESRRGTYSFPELQEKMSKKEPSTASVKQDSSHSSVERGPKIKDRPEIVQKVSPESTFSDGKRRIFCDSVLSGKVSAS